MRKLMFLATSGLLATAAFAQSGYVVQNPVVIQVPPPATVYQFPSGGATVLPNGTILPHGTVISNGAHGQIVNSDGTVRNCPPGLAKKNNGCLPPGQAKKMQNNDVAVMGASGHPVLVEREHKGNKGHGEGGKHKNK